MKSLIIHMPSSTERAENVAHLMDALPNAQVVQAVDGRDVEQTKHISIFDGSLHQPSYPFALNKGEIGCFLSHRKCWELIAAGDAPYALIVEDDVQVLPAAFKDALSLVTRFADENSFFRLPPKARERAAAGETEQQGTSVLFTPQTIGLQTVCQIVGKQAAARLLDATKQIDRPVDTMLQMHWVTGQKIRTVLPNGLSEMPVTSTIQTRPRTREWLSREIKRMIYRSKISRKPQI